MDIVVFNKFFCRLTMNILLVFLGFCTEAFLVRDTKRLRASHSSLNIVLKHFTRSQNITLLSMKSLSPLMMKHLVVVRIGTG